MGSLPLREPRVKPKKRVVDRCPIFEPFGVRCSAPSASHLLGFASEAHAIGLSGLATVVGPLVRDNTDTQAPCIWLANASRPGALSLSFGDRGLPALSARARDAHPQGANSYGIGEASSGLPLWGARRAQAPRLGLPGLRCAV